MILEPWDWRYKIQSDRKLSEQIFKQISEINDKKIRQLYLKLHDFFSNSSRNDNEFQNLNNYLEIILSRKQINYILNYEVSPITSNPPSCYLKNEDFYKFVEDKIKKFRDKLNFDFIFTVTENEEGFGEYWPTLLTQKDKNELIVHKNRNSLEMYNLELTIIHELLGHGIFYDFILKNNLSFVDHGSVLIEGWPTYIEWNYQNNPRSQFNKSFSISVLKAKILGNEDEVKDLYKIAGYDEKTYESNSISYKSYPGFIESYCIGAMFLELQYKDLPLNKSLANVLKNGCGDFFLWDTMECGRFLSSRKA